MTLFFFFLLYNFFGDFMKQNAKIILFSCLVGTILAGIFFLSIKDKAEAKSAPIVYVFQVGVFKNVDNASNLLHTYPLGRLIKDKEFYRVFIGVTSTNKEKMSSLFDSQGYDYYIKEIQVTDVVLETVKKYDEILVQASTDSQLTIINKMLESLPDEL